MYCLIITFIIIETLEKQKQTRLHQIIYFYSLNYNLNIYLLIFIDLVLELPSDNLKSLPSNTMQDSSAMVNNNFVKARKMPNQEDYPQNISPSLSKNTLI